MPEPEINDTVTIADAGTGAKTCPLRRRLAKGWTPRQASRLFAHLIAAIGLMAGLGVVAWFSGEIVRCRWKTIQETDTHGYIEMAKAFAQFQWPRWPDEFSRFRGHVWIDPVPATAPAVTPESSAAPPVMAKYSPGWPLLLVIGYWLDDARGMLWVNPILAMLGALMFFLIARELAGNVAAAICVFIWVTAPMTLMYTTYPLGHGPEITFTLLAVFFAMRWGRAARMYWAFPAAFCTAFLPLIRPTTVLFWPAIALTYLVIRHETRSTAAGGGGAAAVADSATRTWRDLATGPRRWLRHLELRRFLKWLRGPEGRPWLAAGAGAALPLLFLAWYNYHSFGYLFRTGYYFTTEQKAFDLDWLIPGFNAWFGSTWSGGQGAQWVDWRWQAVWQERCFVLENGFLLLGVLGLAVRRAPWLDRSWSRRFKPNGMKMHDVWGDQNRSRRVHAEMTKLGPDGIKALFASQLQAHLDAGRKVLLLVEDDHAVLGWARANAGWQVAKVYERVVTPESERQGLDALLLWEVRMAPPAAAPGPEAGKAKE